MLVKLVQQSTHPIIPQLDHAIVQAAKLIENLISTITHGIIIIIITHHDFFPII